MKEKDTMQRKEMEAARYYDVFLFPAECRVPNQLLLSVVLCISSVRFDSLDRGLEKVSLSRAGREERIVFTRSFLSLSFCEAANFLWFSNLSLSVFSQVRPGSNKECENEPIFEER